MTCWGDLFFLIFITFNFILYRFTSDDESQSAATTSSDFSAFLSSFPVSCDGQPPTKRQRVSAGFPRGRLFYDKWRNTQFDQRQQYLLCKYWSEGLTQATVFCASEPVSPVYCLCVQADGGGGFHTYNCLCSQTLKEVKYYTEALIFETLSFPSKKIYKL